MEDNKQTKAWKKRCEQLAGTPGVKTVLRPLLNGSTLPLSYVRSGPEASTPILVLPGGPGLASVLPYRMLRMAAAKLDLDVLMVEHRGVGMSRKSEDGSDLEPSDLAVVAVLADLVAVLDAEGIEQVIVYGSSYGSYLAGAFGAVYPGRVAGMILDFEADPCDIRGALPRFDWPTLVISGDRDIRTPRTTAEVIVASAPHAERVPVYHHGHSALDTAQPVALKAMQHLASRGTGARHDLQELSGQPSILGRLLSARLNVAKYLPARLS